MAGLPEFVLTERELDELERKVQELRSAFLQEMTALKEIRDFVLPYRGKFDGEKAGQDGMRKDRDVLCHEAILALRTLAAGLQSGVTSPARPWFRLCTADPTEESEEVRIYLDDTQKRMEAVFSRSNFYNCAAAKYAELGGFGTGVMLIEEDFEDVIRCRTLTAGEYWLGLDDRLRVDRLARKVDMTAKQLIEGFGEEALPASRRGSILQERAGEDRRYAVYHLIEPNPKHDAIRHAEEGGIRPTAFRGIYWLEGEHRQPLRVEGYHEKPFVAPRWDVVSDAIYGRSPAWECLGLIKATNRMEEDFLDGLAMQVKPPVLVPSDMSDVNIYPGAINYYTEGSSVSAASRVGSFYEVRADLVSAASKIAANERKIGQFFYTDLFAMLTYGDPRRMTAREVVERHEEKLLLLGPVLERLDAEDLNVCIERVYGIMLRAGLLLEVPEELEGREIKIEYVSILAQAQKMVRIKGITDLLEFVGAVAQMDRNVLERVDFQEAVKQFADYVGTPAGVVFGDEVYERRRKERQAAEEQMELMAQVQQAGNVAGQAANTVKALSQAGVPGANVLDGLAAQMGGMAGG